MKAAGLFADGAMTTPIHESLQEKELLPAIHTVDTGYVDAELMVTSQQDYGIELLGLPKADQKWQARTLTGFDASQFVIDWERQQATCPQGRTSLSWTPAIDRGKSPVVKIKFSQTDCKPCPCGAACTKAKRRTETQREAQHKGKDRSRDLPHITESILHTKYSLACS